MNQSLEKCLDINKKLLITAVSIKVEKLIFFLHFSLVLYFLFCISVNFFQIGKTEFGSLLPDLSRLNDIGLTFFLLVYPWKEDFAGNLHEKQITTWAICSCKVTIFHFLRRTPGYCARGYCCTPLQGHNSESSNLGEKYCLWPVSICKMVLFSVVDVYC